MDFPELEAANDFVSNCILDFGSCMFIQVFCNDYYLEKMMLPN